MSDSWQAAQARAHFAELVEAAVEGKPQFIRRRDGHQVVLVSRDYFDRTKHNLKTYLVTAGFAEDGDDEFDAALREIRRTGPQLAPRGIRLKK